MTLFYRSLRKMGYSPETALALAIRLASETPGQLALYLREGK